MRSFRTIGTALTVAMVMAATMMVSSERVLAAPGGGNSKVVLCRNLERAIASLTAIYGADSELVANVQAQYDALGCGAQ
jgi:hypothetical protein